MKPLNLAQCVPQLNLVKSDMTSLRELADTLVAHNLQSYHTLVSSDGYVDTRQWKELRRKDGLKVYKERSGSGTLPCITSLLLLGTVVGKLDDVLFVAVAATDEQMKLSSMCLQDSVLDSKVLQSVVVPTAEQPFRHVSVKWRLHKARDFVCVDTTGVTTTCKGEEMGYCISHSVAFEQIPNFEKFGVERANLSVCYLFRQKTPDLVECYARGFFDFPSDTNDLLSILSMNAVATKWLSFSKYADCAEMKKLIWQMRKNPGLPPNGPMTIESIERNNISVEKSKRGCVVCRRSLSFFLRWTCKICLGAVCSSCSVKKLVCVLAPDRRTVLNKKRTFCIMCLCQVTKSDALVIARDEIRELNSQPEGQSQVSQKQQQTE